MVFSVVVFFHPFFTAFVIMQYLLGFKLFLAEKKDILFSFPMPMMKNTGYS